MRENNKTEYQLRINGEPVKYFDSIGADEISEWLDHVESNPESYVDISLVRTEILFSPHRYFAMQRHFIKGGDKK
jgi:hypothetical protein